MVQEQRGCGRCGAYIPPALSYRCHAHATAHISTTTKFLKLYHIFPEHNRSLQYQQLHNSHNSTDKILSLPFFIRGMAITPVYNTCRLCISSSTVASTREAASWGSDGNLGSFHTRSKASPTRRCTRRINRSGENGGGEVALVGCPLSLLSYSRTDGARHKHVTAQGDKGWS